MNKTKKEKDNCLYIYYDNTPEHLPCAIGTTTMELARNALRVKTGKEPTRGEVLWFRDSTVLPCLSRHKARAEQGKSVRWAKVEWDEDDNFDDIVLDKKEE